MKKVISILLVLLLCFTAYSQSESLTDSQTEQKSRKVEIYFNLNSYAIDSEYNNNNKSLKDLTNLIKSLDCDSLSTLTRVVIMSSTSPDGDVISNNRMSQQRSNSILEYVKNKTAISDSLISIECNGVAWELLREMVVESNTPYKTEVIDIIDNVSIESWQRVNSTDRWQTLVDSRNKHLMDLRLGIPYNYMMANIFPSLRKSSVVTTYYKREDDPIIKNDVTEISESVGSIEESTKNPTEEFTTTEQQAKSKKPLFAIKSNLLYNIILIPNIELEIPIKNKWSISGEWIFPWWTTNNNAYALQMLSGQLEGRYWFGDRTNKPQLTGWFAGLYAGGGLYDFQWDSNGYQGEFFIASGLSGGYAHTINKSGSLRMEYSLGLGYLKTNYRYYEGMEDNNYLVWQHDGNYTWIGPTKAKVSLVWMLNKRGGKR